MTGSDTKVDLNPPCTARTGVGIGVLVVVAIALAVLILRWWFR